MTRCLEIVLALLALAAPALCHDGLLFWGYECRDTQCVKVALNGDNMGKGQTVCRMLCGHDIGTLWPKPSGSIKKGDTVTQIDRSRIKILTPPNLPNKRLWQLVKRRFHIQIDNKIPEPSLLSSGGRPALITIIVDEVPVNSDDLPRLTYETDESYSLKISQSDEHVLVEIKGKTFFGARHGLETLSQVIVYDEIGESLQIITDTEITDAPAYKHRGVILDTARNYFSVKSIKRTIDGMAMSKLNVLHWHLTDSSSFPLVVRARPDLHNLGAYSARKVYTRADIIDLSEYARSRGVRLIPEFDAPAHVGEGWQNTNFLTCFNAQPWSDYCFEAPCGQLDPTKEEVYDVLEDIYREIFEAFDPDVLHMGSDAVQYNCWNTSETLRNWMLERNMTLNADGFINLWGYFQQRALERVDKVAGDRNVSVILYGVPYLEEPYIDKYIDSSRYIVQFYDDGSAVKSDVIKSRGLRMLATTDAFFIDNENAKFDGGWDDIGGWQKIYNTRPENIIGGPSELLLGSEAAVYTEQIDEFSLDSFLWPKASALGERLWTNPDHGWQKANSRFSMHRTHLTENGLGAAALQPEWCFLNSNECQKFKYD